MAKKHKTNAVRLLEQQKIAFELIEYELTGDQVDGVTVASEIGYPVFVVYKTIVVTASHGENFVCIIPVNNELNLKAVAKVVGEKKSRVTTSKGFASYHRIYSWGMFPFWDEKTISYGSRYKCRESGVYNRQWWEDWSSGETYIARLTQDDRGNNSRYTKNRK